MESTKEQVLHLLQQRTGATVAELASALNVGQASIRRHLDHLRLDGLVDARVERHGVGRPAFLYFATAQAEERSPAGYSRLLGRLYEGLRSLDETQISGRGGAAVLNSAFEHVSEQIAHAHRDEVDGRSLEQRVAQTSSALKGEGIVDEWTAADDGFRLKNAACPYKQATLTTRAPCEADRRVIELLVSAPVLQVSRIADGQSVCEYHVSREPAIEGKESA